VLGGYSKGRQPLRRVAGERQLGDPQRLQRGLSVREATRPRRCRQDLGRRDRACAEWLVRDFQQTCLCGFVMGVISVQMSDQNGRVEDYQSGHSRLRRPRRRRR
jgi:hypothetical protein